MGYYDDVMANLAKHSEQVGIPYGSKPGARQFMTSLAQNRFSQTPQGVQYAQLDAQAEQAALNRRAQAQAQAATIAAQRQQQMRGFAGSLVGEAGRERGLGETEEARAGLSRLVGQGGELSSQAIAEQARRAAGQARGDIAGQEGQLSSAFAARGITNPAAVAAATAAGRGQVLGMGARIQSQGERENARSLVGILGQASYLGQARASLQAATSYEDMQSRVQAQDAAAERARQAALARFRAGGLQSRLA